MTAPDVFTLPPLTEDEERQVRIALNFGEMVAKRDSLIAELRDENARLRRIVREMGARATA